MDTSDTLLPVFISPYTHIHTHSSYIANSKGRFKKKNRIGNERSTFGRKKELGTVVVTGADGKG